jgi:hypothetical protein
MTSRAGVIATSAATALTAAAALVLVPLVILQPTDSAAASCTTISTSTAGPPAASASATGPTPAHSSSPGNALASLDQQAQTNARIVTAVVVARRLPARALAIVLMTALAESGLHNDDYGDAAGPDSRGILQQRDSWGPLAVRMDPAGATGLFLDRLVNLADWASMPPWVAAQQVQVSAFDGHPSAANDYSSVVGGNYLAKAAVALAITQQLFGDPGLSLSCPTGGAPGSAGPVPVTLTGLPEPPGAYAVPAGGGPCDVPDGGGCIREATAHLRAAVLAAFPTQIRSVGCYSDRPGDHGTGVACDFMLTNGAAATGQDYLNGWQLAAWVRTNAAQLGVAYVIWYLRIWDSRHPQPDDNAGWGQPYDGCSYCPSVIGDPSAAHTNHVHVSIRSSVTE